MPNIDPDKLAAAKAAYTKTQQDDEAKRSAEFAARRRSDEEAQRRVAERKQSAHNAGVELAVDAALQDEQLRLLISRYCEMHQRRKNLMRGIEATRNGRPIEIESKSDLVPVTNLFDYLRGRDGTEAYLDEDGDELLAGIREGYAAVQAA